MIKITMKVILSLFIAVGFFACSDDEVEVQPTLEVAEAAINFTKASVKKTIDVTTNQTDWKVESSDPDWCDVSKRNLPSPQIQIKVEQNNKTYSRKAEITVTTGILKKIIKVEQLGSDPAMKLTLDSIYIENNEVDTIVKLTTNVETVVVDISKEVDWITITEDKTKKGEYTVSIPENKSLNERTGEIVFKSSDPSENISATIKVKQLGKIPTMKLSHDSLYVENSEIDRIVKITTNVEKVVIEIPEELDWVTVTEDKEKKGEYIFSIKENRSINERVGEVVFKSSDPKENISVPFTITQRKIVANSSDVDVPEDIKVIPTSGKANQSQPGQGIENTFDGVFGGPPYHSPWGDGTQMPVILEYFFEGSGKAPELIDYLVYHTRSGNGNFGKLNLYVATTEKPEYELYGNYNFRGTNSPTKVTFTDGLKNPTKIKFEVLSGNGGYASCDEMEFFKKNKESDLLVDILAVFTDASCSNLKEGVTDEQINKLNPFFGEIAKKMKLDDYPRDFRVAEYPAYSIVEEWSEKLLINHRGVLDNCTGIYAEADEEVMILVGDTYGNQLKLRSITDGNFFGNDYMLNEGLNKIKVRNKGLLYILYNVKDIQAATSKPIKIHFPMQSGKVNGYWDIGKHKTNEKYKELLANATYPFFEIKGTDIMLKFHTNRLREFVPNIILPSIGFWDEMVQVEQAIMGWEGIYPEKMNNRMYARSSEDGYMSAQAYQTNFNENILWKILSPEVMRQDEDNPWGPAHEIGHMNQGAINWPGNTETSNNLFSNLVRYKMTDFDSRGESLENINQRHVVKRQSFNDHTDNIPSLRMQWQLYCYFHILENDERFFPELFRISREPGRRPSNNPGWSQLNYVRNACDAAQLNLLDFFEFWGFLSVEDVEISQYGNYRVIVTQQMIDETVSYVESKGYNKPKQVIHYIEDREPTNYGDVGKMNKQFKENMKITKDVTYTRSGNSITIQNGDQAIGFEVRDDNELKFVSNKFSFSIDPVGWDDNFKVFAVQADGVRKELTTN